MVVNVLYTTLSQIARGNFIFFSRFFTGLDIVRLAMYTRDIQFDFPAAGGGAVGGAGCGFARVVSERYKDFIFLR